MSEKPMTASEVEARLREMPNLEPWKKLDKAVDEYLKAILPKT